MSAQAVALTVLIVPFVVTVIGGLAMYVRALWPKPLDEQIARDHRDVFGPMERRAMARRELGRRR